MTRFPKFIGRANRTPEQMQAQALRQHFISCHAAAMDAGFTGYAAALSALYLLEFGEAMP